MAAVTVTSHHNLYVPAYGIAMGGFGSRLVDAASDPVPPHRCRPQIGAGHGLGARRQRRDLPLVRPASACPLARRLGTSGLPTGRLARIAAGSTLARSSLGTAPLTGCQEANWIRGAVDGATQAGSVNDARTGPQVLVVPTPVDGSIRRQSRRSTLRALVVVSLMLPLVIATALVSRGRTGLRRIWPRRPGRAIVARVQSTPGQPAVVPTEDARDIDHLKASLRDELDATARAAAIVDSSNDSIISWTPAGIITTWNSRSEEMYGYSAEAAIGRDMSLIVPPARLAEVTLLHELVLRGEPVGPVETQKVCRDGSLADVSVTVSLIRDRTGASVGLSAVGRDIGESKRVVEALRSSEARTSAIFASALDPIITMDREGRIDGFNPAAERTFGFVSAEVIGRQLSEVILPPGPRDLHERGLERFLATGDPSLSGRCTEMNAVRADGVIFPAEVTINAADVSGSPLLTAFIRDVTDRRAAEAERRSLEDRLHQSQRLESLGQLAGGVAHDFNNLLAVILNHATFVAETVPDDDGVQYDVEQILSASGRAAGLTRQLLMFARREPFRPETLDLDAVVENVRGLLSHSIGEQIDLVVTAGADLPAIRADRGQTEQILLNLAVNARDAMPDGGTLTIATAAVDIDVEYAQLNPGTSHGPYVQLSVSDNGTGMSRDVASHAFEPFFTTKSRANGSGLGLATVYGIITEAGGAVNLYSEEGLGTTVKVYFPATTDSAAVATTRSQLTPIRGDGGTILVVEDQDAVRAVTVRILRRNGFVALEAASGADAISIAAAHHIDLLLTDVVMPKMAGRELAQLLTRDHPTLPVLYMSGYTGNLLGPERSLDDGVALVQKPFNEITLLHAVHEAMSGSVRPAVGPDAAVAP